MGEMNYTRMFVIALVSMPIGMALSWFLVGVPPNIGGVLGAFGGAYLLERYVTKGKK